MSDLYWKLLDAAYEQAEKSYREGGIPIGGVIARKNGEIIARGHNERVQRGDPTAHGEMSTFRNAGRRRDFSEMILVTTLSPCFMCAGTARLYRIPIVVIGENRTGQVCEEWLRKEGAEVVVLNDDRCYQLMQRFAKEQPDLWKEDYGY